MEEAPRILKETTLPPEHVESTPFQASSWVRNVFIPTPRRVPERHYRFLDRACSRGLVLLEDTRESTVLQLPDCDQHILRLLK